MNKPLWLLLALLMVAGVRLHGLAAAALPDYDSVRNWQIVQEVAVGDLRNLYHHGSPGFSLLYAPVAWFTTDFHVFQYLNALVGVVAVGWLTLFISREARLAGYEAGLLVLFIGVSTFLTFSGRDFTMGSWGLVVFTGLLQAYYERLRQATPRSLLRAAVWVTIGLCINYKFLLTLPILAVFELLQQDGLLLRPRNLLRVLAILATPYVVLAAVSLAVGLPWYRWLAVYYNIVRPGAPNAAGRQGMAHLDALYYLKFLRDFESPLVLLGLVAVPLLWRRALFQKLKQPNLVRYLAIWVYCFLVGMSLLLKAPRGLLLIYGLLYALTFLSLRQVLDRRWWALSLVVLVAVGFNLGHIQREIYAYTPSHYPEVAAWLRKHGSPPVISTVGQGLVPYVVPGSVAVITDEHTLPALRRQGYRYVLLDDYWRVTNVLNFDSLRQLPVVAAWPEPLLTAPLLFLEHSEYTSLGYDETLALQRAARRDSLQLRLISIN
ncbi:hypothetical protein [Hymenobacter cavernae]|uniref:Glycosyltransferase RgtA/B/C/D-like domain-containing protein n=1 Tax=Hymenobacter cavernae TaxID=2044852 RepID=A0ABQ1TIE1_9BACT|nr:hypothetical protein [Hymenobacter cavernae]GGE94781.1 hypothetical protein GCM10011383_01890 [Hymenobacter cavernae]